MYLRTSYFEAKHGTQGHVCVSTSTPGTVGKVEAKNVKEIWHLKTNQFELWLRVRWEKVLKILEESDKPYEAIVVFWIPIICGHICIVNVFL